MTRRLSLVTVFFGVALALPLWPSGATRTPSAARSAPRTAPSFRASDGHFTIRVSRLDAHIALAGNRR